MTKTFVAACGPLGGATKLLYSDLSLKKSGDEPLPELLDALENLGFQPETLKAFVDGTKRSITKRRSRAGAIARKIATSVDVVHVPRSYFMDSAERLRKACGGIVGSEDRDELFTLIVKGQAIPFGGQKFTGILKAKHSMRAADGKFHPAVGVDAFVQDSDGGQWSLGGAVHPSLLRLAAQRGGKKHPPNIDKPIPGMYGNAGLGSSAPGNS